MKWKFHPQVSLIWISLVRSALFAAALGAGLAYASDPGSDQDDDIDISSDDSSGDPGDGGQDDADSDDLDNSDASGDDDNSDSGGASGDDDSGSGNSDDGGPGSSSEGQGAALEAAHYGLALDAITVERDETGAERVAGEVLFTGQVDELATARDAGFEVISERPLASIQSAIARLRIPNNTSVDQAVGALRALAPRAWVTANSIYRSAEVDTAPGRPATRVRGGGFVGVLGIIDTGVDARALTSPSALLSQRSFAAAAPVAREHGSLVAALAINEGMQVHVADVFGQSADGAMAASADSIAAALDWMIANNVAVINVSVEGPNNAVLAALVERAARRGHVIVAAAGNGGPLARPAFPAAFAGSVAVTAIDANDRPYLRANRGAYIAFAAPGVDMSVRSGGSDIIVSGTSFAAPLVAAKIAARLRQPSPARARAVLAALQHQAIDLGAPGRDPIFGWGALRD